MILKWKASDYNELEKVKALFLPYNKVWQLESFYHFKIPQYQNGPFIQIDRDQIT